ncbi:amidohydrolase family protein [Hanstruepera marina]|uniref:amidohydrolase family protein n=1 Tax=Hanstruepera marina TaxID=2873265 RepID=UPI001CA60BFC|nr:amidohydrolase family protein [Hanstruepera marina]
MKKYLLSLVLIFVITIGFSQTYITNVTIIDVDNKKLIADQTVEITNGKISNIQSHKKAIIPENATVIDGANKFLAPGLVDAHVHFFQNGGLYSRPDAIDLRGDMPYDKEIELAKNNMKVHSKHYVKNGITSVIDVGSTYNMLEKRQQLKNDSLAPNIYMTGPLLTTYEPEVYSNLNKDEPFSLVKTINDGIKMVQNQLQYNPDFIKIWYIVGLDGLDNESSARKNLPIIKAIIEESHKNNLKVAVHATQRITAQLAVENGADFLVHSIDDEIITSDFANLLKRNNTILCPTLIVHDRYIKTFAQNYDFDNHELLESNPYQLGTLMDLSHIDNKQLVDGYKTMANSQQSKTRTESINSTMMTNLKTLVDADVTIATGTDAGNIGTLHASSYLAEIMAMKKSGMTNWQIIEASTINGAKVLGQENNIGSVSVGKQANLILLDKNPIDDLNNLTSISQIINKGHVLKVNSIIENSPEALAQRQLNAYNSRNIDAFLEPYADDVEVYNFPDKLLFKGKDAMRTGYASMFENTPNLHCELENRIVQGNIVIDEERVQFGDNLLEATAIYHIEKGKIKKVFFIN